MKHGETRWVHLFQVKPLDCESPCVNVSTYFQPFQRSICCKYGSLMSRKFPLTKLVGYPKTNRSFSIIENKRLWDILILSLQFVMPEDENWKISIKGTSPPSIPLLSPIIFQMFNVWSNVAIFLICQWPYSYMNVWANVCIYIYIYINLVLSMEYPWSIFLVYNMRHNQTNHEKETLPIWLNGSAQVGFDRPLIPVLIDSLRNKRPKTSNHELDASLGPIVWWRKNPNRKKGPSTAFKWKKLPRW